MSEVQSVRHTLVCRELTKEVSQRNERQTEVSDHVGYPFAVFPLSSLLILVPHVLISPLQFLETVRPTSVQRRSAIQICGSF